MVFKTKKTKNLWDKYNLIHLWRLDQIYLDSKYSVVARGKHHPHIDRNTLTHLEKRFLLVAKLFDLMWQVNTKKTDKHGKNASLERSILAYHKRKIPLDHGGWSLKIISLSEEYYSRRYCGDHFNHSYKLVPYY